MSKCRRLIVLTIQSNMDFTSCPLFALCWDKYFSELSISEIFIAACRRKVDAREELCLVKIEIFTFTHVIGSIFSLFQSCGGSSSSNVPKTLIKVLEIVKSMWIPHVVFTCVSIQICCGRETIKYTLSGLLILWQKPGIVGSATNHDRSVGKVWCWINLALIF